MMRTVVRERSILGKNFVIGTKHIANIARKVSKSVRCMMKKNFQADDLFCSFMLSQRLQSTMIVQGIQSLVALH